jgi:hypothetical protein
MTFQMNITLKAARTAEFAHLSPFAQAAKRRQKIKQILWLFGTSKMSSVFSTHFRARRT